MCVCIAVVIGGPCRPRIIITAKSIRLLSFDALELFFFVKRADFLQHPLDHCCCLSLYIHIYTIYLYDTPTPPVPNTCS